MEISPAQSAHNVRLERIRTAPKLFELTEDLDDLYHRYRFTPHARDAIEAALDYISRRQEDNIAAHIEAAEARAEDREIHRQDVG